MSKQTSTITICTSNTKAESKSDDEVKREEWSSKFEYILSLVGYAIGLGNVWRLVSVIKIAIKIYNNLKLFYKNKTIDFRICATKMVEVN
jgi:hypothetical protein